MIPFSHRKSCVAISAALLMLVGCGGDHDKAATQVAARVNKDEVSVHQINYVLSHSGAIAAEQVQAASKQVLDKLVDQNLLMQKAITEKMDRDPNVMVGIEMSRRQIIAQAYLDKVMNAVPKPTTDEIHDYYVKNPDLFSQRRVYRFQQVSIAGGKEIVAATQAELTAGKSLADIVAWAQSNKYRVSSNVTVKTAEQLPLQLLPRLHQMKEGQVGLIAEANGVSALQLLASQEQPVDEKTATATIGQFLVNKRKSELAEAELKQLKSAAKIEYMGDFAKKDAAPTATSEANKVAPQAASPAPTPATEQSDAVSKAIAGMK